MIAKPWLIVDFDFGHDVGFCPWKLGHTSRLLACVDTVLRPIFLLEVGQQESEMTCEALLVVA